MNKSTELGMIDFSILTTMGKKGDYSSYENVVGALENYVINNNPMGFTRKDNARDYIKSLSKDDIRKELLKNIKLELPETPDIKDFKKLMLNRDEKIENEIIKPKDDLINKLYNENISLHKELSKQANTVNIAIEYEKKHPQILEDNVNLKFKCKKLEKTLENKEKELKQQFEDETYKIDYQYQKIINKLEKENNYLKKVIDRFKFTVQKFITWICHNFSAPSEEVLIRDFERETYMDFDVEKQLNINRFDKEQQEEELEY